MSKEENSPLSVNKSPQSKNGSPELKKQPSAAKKIIPMFSNKEPEENFRGLKHHAR